MAFPFSRLTSQLLDLALAEDLHAGDPSTDAVFGADDRTSGQWIAKEELVLAGLPIVEEIFQRIDADVTLHWQQPDGASVGSGVFGTLEGPTRAILRGERTALNFLRHLSGVATFTRRHVEAMGPTATLLADTRKTTPGMRELEKYAVRMGGGTNHRYSLGSGVMLKDNHIAAAGSITEAVRSARAHAPLLLRIEVEIERLDQIEEALAAGADILMLDNMDIPTMREAIDRINGRCLVEISGNVTLERLPALGELGATMISSGALTHSAPQVDISLRLLDRSADGATASSEASAP